MDRPIEVCALNNNWERNISLRFILTVNNFDSYLVADNFTV